MYTCSGCCQVCDEPFDNIHTFVQHGKVHTGSGSLVCSWCGDVFRSVVSLTIHQMVWRKEDEGVCETDDESREGESSKYKLKREDGDGEKFGCPLNCGNQAYSLDALKVSIDCKAGSTVQ